MPGRDGTGPMGGGPMTGRGLGVCLGTAAAGGAAYFGVRSLCRCGRGLGLGRGFGRGFSANAAFTGSEKDVLTSERDALKERLDVIDKKLESL